MSLIWSIPLGVLLLAALLIVLVNRSRPNIGISWFSAIIAALFVWGWTISLFWQTDLRSGDLPAGESAGIQIRTDNSFARSVLAADEDNPGFVLDRISYPYMLAVSAVLVVLLLTAPSYMEPQTAPRIWFFYLLIEAIGFLSVSANRLIIVIYGWVVFDAIDLITRYLQSRPGQISRSFVTAVGVRFTGTILAASGLALSYADGGSAGNIFISSGAGAFLMIACALRMGILPISQPYAEVGVSRVGLGTMLRLVSILTVMPVLSRIPMLTISPNFGVILGIAGGFASLVGAVGWFLSKNSFEGNSYFALAVCGMAFASAIVGNQQSLIVWGISIALVCTPFSVYQIHNVFMNILVFLVLLCFSGLPYTPNAAGWYGLVSFPYSLKDVLFILSMLLLIAGTINHTLKNEGKKFSDLEPWMRSVYPLGILASVGTLFFISFFCYDQPFSLGVIQASVMAFAGGVLLGVFVNRTPERLRTQNFLAWGRESVSFFWMLMQRLLDMNWFFSVGRLAMGITDRVISGITAVLENNGGLIWELLLLAFLIAAAFSGGLQ